MSPRTTRVVAALAALLAVSGGYAGWRLGHPALPAGSRVLDAEPLPPRGLAVQYFGTTTLAFRDGPHAVMVDALLTRLGLRQALFGKIASDPARIDAALRRAALSHLDLLPVSHTHYDHALDIAAVAQRTGARIAGSSSTREVALGGGITDARIAVIHGGEQLQAGPFAITVFRSLHSRGDRVPGEVTAPLHQPATIKDYREGGTYSFLIADGGFTMLVHASANFVPGMYRGIHADVVFLATGGLSTQPEGFTRTYWREVVETTGARLVIPIHWDDFLAPLDQPLQPLRRFMDDIPLTMARIAPLAARDHVTVAYLPVIAPVDIAAAARQAAR